MERVDCVVIGAGVVGLAVARELALAGREVVVLEAAGAIGTETSSRNSEVIHAGIYYAPGSLKAVSCVNGRQLLYRYCAERGVAHRRCGKLIVATETAQIATLHNIQAHAAANGVDDLRLLTADEAKAMEPQLRCVAALLSPSTGIIDSHGLMLAYRGEAEDHGAMLALHSPVTGGTVQTGGIVLEVGGAEPMQLLARTVVNSAGLYAQRVAAALRGFPQDLVPPTHFAKGNYYSLSGRSPFLSSDLPGTGGRRPGRAPDPGPRRSGALRTGRGMDHGNRLRCRLAPRRWFLSGDTRLLAGVERRTTGAGLRRHTAQARRPGQAGQRFCDPGSR